MTFTTPAIDDSHMIFAGDLTGKTLFDRAGHKLGSIKEVLVDKVTGQVEFVLGATGGFLGVGEKFHPLPWGLLAFNQTPEGYIVGVDNEAITAAPAYDRDQLTGANYGWGEQVHRYYASLRRV